MTRQTIRRDHLRILAPLADTTIYEMEQRCKNSYAARARPAPSPEDHLRCSRSATKSASMGVGCDGDLVVTSHLRCAVS